VISARRRRTDAAARGAILVLTLIALVPLVLVVSYLLERGIGALSGSFFTTDPTGNFFGDPGGVRSAILGTVEIVALASAVAIPLGVAVALYLVEGPASRYAGAVRYLVDVMTGVPSIVFGLFVYLTLVGRSFAGYKGSLALALLMLPVVARSAEVVLPAALPGLVTGSLLAVARGAGETAPLLFTAAAVNGLTFDVGGRMNSLPVQIFSDVASPNDALVARAWGSALVLVAMVLALTLLARLASRRSVLR
jgi:phosphate transport system permease protein